MDWPIAGVIITALSGIAATAIARYNSQRPPEVSDTIVKALIQNVNTVQTEIALLKQTDQHLADKLDSFTAEWRQYTKDRERTQGQLSTQLQNMTLEIAKLTTEVNGMRHREDNT